MSELQAYQNYSWLCQKPMEYKLGESKYLRVVVTVNIDMRGKKYENQLLKEVAKNVSRRYNINRKTAQKQSKIELTRHNLCVGSSGMNSIYLEAEHIVYIPIIEELKKTKIGDFFIDGNAVMVVDYVENWERDIEECKNRIMNGV